MAIRWIGDGEPPAAEVFNRPLRDFIVDSGWLLKSTRNQVSSDIDIRTLPSGSYYLPSGHPNSPSIYAVTLLVQMSESGKGTFYAQRAGDYAVHIASTWNNETGTIVWAEVYHSRNQLNIGTTATSARSALRLGNTATHNYGTSAGTVAQGNDSRIVNAASVSYVNTGLNAKANQSTSINTGAGLRGGGNLAGSRTLSVEPGAIPLTSIGLNTDNLNNIRTPGYYHQVSNDATRPGRNYPIEVAGALVVLNSAGITQEYTTYSVVNRKFIRGYYDYGGGGWSPWVEFYSSVNMPPSAPIGMSYTQYPGHAAPATLFGGKWSLQFNNEGVFFRTEGGHASGFGAGIQGDEFKRHYHGRPQTGHTVQGGGSVLRINMDDGPPFSGEVNDNNVGGVETRPRNRTMRIWIRTG